MTSGVGVDIQAGGLDDGEGGLFVPDGLREIRLRTLRSSGLKPRVLLTGGSGRLGAYVAAELRRRELTFVSWSGPRGTTAETKIGGAVDLTDRESLAAEFDLAGPTLVIHAAALSTVDGCLTDPQRAERVNVQATGELARLAAGRGAKLVYTSTDLVFDGEAGPYSEDSSTCAVSVYGQTKSAGELEVLQYPSHAVVRLSLLFGPKRGPRDSFFDLQLQALRSRDRRMKLFTDEWRTPLDYQSAARGLLDIGLLDIEQLDVGAESGGGIWHLAGPERMSRWEMGDRLAKFLNVREPPFDRSERSEAPGSEPRPQDVSLTCDRWRKAFPDAPRPGFEESLRRLLEREPGVGG